MEMEAQKWLTGLTFLLIVVMESMTVTAANLEPIYWNSMNRRFGEERGYILYPQMGDRLDLVCPASTLYEFYKLYLVSEHQQADRCELSDAPNLLLTCDKPNADTRFTIKFQEFSPNLWGHEFKNLQDYYILATSDGTKQGIDNMKGGVCVTRGMKVVLKVGQSPYRPLPKPKHDPGQSSSRTPGSRDPTMDSSNSVNPAEADGGDDVVPSSVMPMIVGGVGGATFLLLVAVVIGVLCYRRRKAKHSETQHPSLTLSGVTPRRGRANGGANVGVTTGGTMGGGTEPSDIIIPLRTSDSTYCPHYDKVSGDYGHPVYIVQEVPAQNPANIYYKV